MNVWDFREDESLATKHTGVFQKNRKWKEKEHVDNNVNTFLLEEEAQKRNSRFSVPRSGIWTSIHHKQVPEGQVQTSTQGVINRISLACTRSSW